jgi:glycosyl transferase family 2
LSSVDVIVPCYRYGQFLRECLHSVLAQSVSNLRVLIIDDASPDDTSEIATDLAKGHSRITFLKHVSNKGHISTYNEGIEWASSDYMLILSADDYLLPGALNRAINLMDSNPEVAFSFGNALQVDPSGAVKPINRVTGKASWRILAGFRFIELSGSRNIVPTPTAVVRTQLQRRLGGYRSELTHSGDMEMWLRLAAHGSVGMLKAYQAVYRRHTGNMSLAYMTEGLLPDLQQRKAALHCFFQTCGHILPNQNRLQRKFYSLLARDAVSLGSSAFNAGKMQTSQALCDFALRTRLAVRWSFAWMKLACKRRMGYEAWSVLQPAIRAVDRMGSLLKHSLKFARKAGVIIRSTGSDTGQTRSEPARGDLSPSACCGVQGKSSHVIARAACASASADRGTEDPAEAENLPGL